MIVLRNDLDDDDFATRLQVRLELAEAVLEKIT